MVQIKVLGPGCFNCQKLATMCQEVVAEYAIEAQIEKVTDLRKIAELGVMLTPGLIINEKLKSSGKIPMKSTLINWLKDATK